MQHPHIHLNGSDAQTLIDGYMAANTAVCLAISAVAETAPNGRDYYTIIASPDAINVAMAEHRARLNRLHDIAAELQALAIAVDAQKRT